MEVKGEVKIEGRVFFSNFEKIFAYQKTVAFSWRRQYWVEYVAAVKFKHKTGTSNENFLAPGGNLYN